MTDDRFWTELRYLAYRQITLRHQLAWAKRYDDRDEAQRISAELVRLGFTRERLVENMATRMAA